MEVMMEVRYFNLMVAGESGLGKSTLLASLFTTDNLSPSSETAETLQKTLQVTVTTNSLEVGEDHVELTLVDTPGFGQNLDDSDSGQSILDYINLQFKRCLDAEKRGRAFEDTRVHCLLYFISPYGRGLKPLDLEVMKKLDGKVNLVPIIAKADGLTKTETIKLKARVLEELAAANIGTFQLHEPEVDSKKVCTLDEKAVDLRGNQPFAVCGANARLDVAGQKVRVRQFPWGNVEVENPDHCDFAVLRRFLLAHIQELQQVTHHDHYETARAETLQPFQRHALAMKKRRESAASTLNFNNNFL